MIGIAVSGKGLGVDRGGLKFVFLFLCLADNQEAGKGEI